MSHINIKKERKKTNERRKVERGSLKVFSYTLRECQSTPLSQGRGRSAPKVGVIFFGIDDLGVGHSYNFCVSTGVDNLLGGERLKVVTTQLPPWCRPPNPSKGEKVVYYP